MTADDTAHNAQSMARHVKAALMHLRQAEDAAELAGIDIDGGNEGANLIRAAGYAVDDLDSWASNNLPGRDARLGAYQHTERWCQAEGGQLAAGSWPREPSTAQAGAEGAAACPGVRLCAHADQNGDGMHWLEPGEKCGGIEAGQ